jgi:hypothetical protein
MLQVYTYQTNMAAMFLPYMLLNLQAVWKISNVKSWKAFWRTDIVWVFYLKTIKQMPDSAWVLPFVTMVTYRNTFEVVFATSDGKALDGGGDWHLRWKLF